MKWTTVPDHEVRHIWIDDDGTQHDIPPWFYEDVGTPIDESGIDMTYSHTEVALATVWDFTAIAVTVAFTFGVLWLVAVLLA